ncbi:hypothetical protein TRFO_10301 [Tritrichomonas foetus]|uniref:Protein kinase domain-containing protein n=1 Tax=Tritrichomonas foetus TaxID=1144522 RepID=A0A1J4JB45_9EUKA|nr:hypothetical protein TRFO_10301 [Tritrichomonas foetus]|eukprot:OHS95889.1 hypothetical protein TRFO_10301 [Tritrichomonas foetus]
MTFFIRLTFHSLTYPHHFPIQKVKLFLGSLQLYDLENFEKCGVKIRYPKFVNIGQSYGQIIKMNFADKYIITAASSRSTIMFFYNKAYEYQVCKIYTSSFTDFHRRREISREAQALDNLRHPAMVQRYPAPQLPDLISGEKVIALDLISGGSLFDVLVQEETGNPVKKWDFTQKVIVIYGIARFLNFLNQPNERNYIYRDLKPHNVLLNHKLQPILCDFETVKEENSGTNNTIVGTRYYSPPEQLCNNGHYNSSATVYSFGSTVFAMLTLKVPFLDCGLSEEAQNFPRMSNESIQKIGRPTIPSDIDPKYLSFVRLTEDCWKSPNERPTFAQINETIENIVNDEFDEDQQARFKKYKMYLDSFESAPGNLMTKIPKDGTFENIKKAADKNIFFAKKIYALALAMGIDTEPNVEEAFNIYLEMAAKTNEEEYVTDIACHDFRSLASVYKFNAQNIHTFLDKYETENGLYDSRFSDD